MLTIVYLFFYYCWLIFFRLILLLISSFNFAPSRLKFCLRHCFNSIYFDIFVVWYFSDCLLLFLSFSPSYVSCVMAPKHKSIPSRNPLRSGASSSSSPSDLTPSHVWFHDEGTKSDFLENFS